MNRFETPQFDENGIVSVEIWTPKHDRVYKSTEQLVKPEISTDPQDLVEALAMVNDGWKIIEDPLSGQQFEVVSINTDQEGKSKKDMKVFLTTWMGSIGGNALAPKGNPGNAYELALNVLAHPDDPIVYMGGLGNGATSAFLPDESRYFREHGYLPEQAPTFRALGRVLLGIGEPRKFSANSAGGRIAMGVIANLPKSIDVTHLYSKGTPGISTLTYRDFRKWQKDSKLAGKSTDIQDPWDVTKERSQQAREALTNVYNESLLSKTKQSKLDFIRARLTAIQGYRQGDKGLIQDLESALERQNNLLPTLHIGLGDLLYPREDDILLTLRRISSLHALGDRAVKAIVTTGRHLDHSHNPSFRIATEDWALNRES